MLGPCHSHFSEARSVLVPPWRLAQLGRNRDPFVREAVAHNERCPVPSLVALATDTWSMVCAAVARNPNTPAPQLWQPMTHPTDQVRWSLVGNPATPPPLLQSLVQDRDVVVREGVARHHATPQAALDILTDDPEARVREAVARRAERAAQLPLVVENRFAEWTAKVAVYGQAAEEVAWSVVCGGFGGSLEELAAVAVGALA